MQGLETAIAEVFPYAQHRHCCRHLYSNFRAQYPGVMLRTLFWKAAKAYTEFEFNEAMEELKKLNPEAYQWLIDKIPARWSRHAFDGRGKSDHITNNMLESFNNWIGQLRGKPILNLIETLLMKWMEKMQQRYADACQW